MSDLNFEHLERAMTVSQKLAGELKGASPDDRKLGVSIQNLLVKRPGLNLFEELQRHNRTMARAIVVANSDIELDPREFNFLYGEERRMQVEHGHALEALHVCRQCAHDLLTYGQVSQTSGAKMDVEKILGLWRINFGFKMFHIDGFPFDRQADRVYVKREKNKAPCHQCVDRHVERLNLLEQDS